MAWESGIRYNAAVAEATREALENRSVEWLANAIANDKYARVFPFTLKEVTCERRERQQKSFDRWVAEASRLPHDVLVEACLDRAERTDTADNGGHMIWIDKDGCSRVRLS